jgi:hypothetical protein
VDAEYLADFERQEFALYDARRLAVETHSNAVIAATLATAAFVLADFNRRSHRCALALLALLGGVWTFASATNARVVSWDTPLWRIGVKRPTSELKPSDEVGETLLAVRDCEGGTTGRDPRPLAIAHWHARAISAWKLGAAKDRRLRWALWGFAGPALYFGARLLG